MKTTTATASTTTLYSQRNIDSRSCTSGQSIPPCPSPKVTTCLRLIEAIQCFYPVYAISSPSCSSLDMVMSPHEEIDTSDDEHPPRSPPAAGCRRRCRPPAPHPAPAPSPAPLPAPPNLLELDPPDNFWSTTRRDGDPGNGRFSLALLIRPRCDSSAVPSPPPPVRWWYAREDILPAEVAARYRGGSGVSASRGGAVAISLLRPGGPSLPSRSRCSAAAAPVVVVVTGLSPCLLRDLLSPCRRRPPAAPPRWPALAAGTAAAAAAAVGGGGSAARCGGAGVVFAARTAIPTPSCFGWERER